MEQTKKNTVRWWVTVIKVLLPLVVLAAGAFGAWHVYKTRPKAKKKTPQKMMATVKVLPLRQGRQSIVLRESGTVIPVREIVLKPRVTGQVVSINPNFSVGSYIKKGEEILLIEPADYELMVKRRQGQAETARADIKLEMGRQEVAQREWELLGGRGKAGGGKSDLALRKPQLEKAKAVLMMAETELDLAKLDLSRTSVRLPFDAMVLAKLVDIGSQVSPQEQLGRLVDTDEYWIQVSVSADHLKWISIPHDGKTTGSKVRVIYGKDGNGRFERAGTVVRLLGDLEKAGRMVRILVSVSDPLNIKTPDAKRMPLLLNEYVRVEIEGKEFGDVIRIPRCALRSGGKVWIVSDETKLEIRDVEVLWKDRQTVLLSDGVKAGEQLIVSDLATPVQAMQLRIEGRQDVKGKGAGRKGAGREGMGRKGTGAQGRKIK